MDERGVGGDDFVATEGVGEERQQATIWGELNAWGNSIADWQRYIISHAVRDGTLTDARVDEAYRLFLRDRRLDNGGEALPDVPASVTGRAVAETAPLSLLAIKSLKNVNAIPEVSHDVLP